MSTSALSPRAWVLPHAKGSVALVAGFADPDLAVALAGEGVSVTFAGPPQTIAHAPALLAGEAAALRARIEVRETEGDLAAFATRQFDLAVIGDGLFAGGLEATAAACARIVDAGALVLFLPPGGAEGLRAGAIATLVDAFHREFAIERLDLVDDGIGVLARRRPPGEAAPGDTPTTFGAIVLALVRRISTEERLSGELRAGLATRDRAFAGLEAELDQALPRGDAWADDEPEGASPVPAPEPAPPAVVPVAATTPAPAPTPDPPAEPAPDPELLAALDRMDASLRAAELRPGRRRLEGSLAELEAVLGATAAGADGNDTEGGAA